MHVYFQVDQENKVTHVSQSRDPWDNSNTDWIFASDKNSMNEIIGLTYNSETNTFS